MAKAKNLKLSDLLINTENYRFEPVASQKEAIDKMVENQGENLYNLAEHIINNGLNPSDRLQAIESLNEKRKYIVLEGNRRTVALKLLNNPDLIDSPKYLSLKKKFKKLSSKNPEVLQRPLPVDIYDDPSEADIWIAIKHGYGKNGIATDAWDPLMKQRYGEKIEGITSTSIQVINLLQKSDEVPNDLKKDLENINTTNLDRLLGDPEVREFLGVEFKNGIIQSSVQEREVIKGLKQVVKDILAPDFTVKNIYRKTDRKAYIDSFPKSSAPDLSRTADKPWQLHKTVADATVPTPVPKKKTLPKERTRLIPKTCSIAILNPKVNSIYHELQNIDVRNFTNAVAVLLRVFVELSVDSYIENNKLANSLSAAKSGLSLQRKILLTIEHLENKALVDKAISKGIKSSAKDNNDILGLETWHNYVHNNKFSPKVEVLLATWDNMELFMTILWNNIK